MSFVYSQTAFFLFKLLLDYAVQTLVPLRMTKMWIGLNDIVEEGKQEWIDGVKSTAKSRLVILGQYV